MPSSVLHRGYRECPASSTNQFAPDAKFIDPIAGPRPRPAPVDRAGPHLGLAEPVVREPDLEDDPTFLLRYGETLMINNLSFIERHQALRARTANCEPPSVGSAAALRDRQVNEMGALGMN